MPRWIGLALLALACTPDPAPVRSLVPEVGVAPAELDFGEQAVPLPRIERVFVSNAGRAPLEVDLLLVDDEHGAFSLPGFEPVTVSAGDALPVDLVFHPGTYLDFGARLVVLTNDEETPEVDVPLLGRGVPGPVPDVDVSPASIDFGEGDDARTEIVTIRNVGLADLEVGDVSLAGSPAFSLLTDPSGTRVAPGNALPVVIRYEPVGDDGDSGKLVVPSNDPDEPEAEVLLLGNGGGDFAYPVARIACPPAPVDPPTWVDLHGRDSTDPEERYPLTYEWTLLRVPTTTDGRPLSDGRLSNAVGETTRLWADAVGAYEVQLVVVNSVGVRSAAARCRISAEPDEDVVVELTWSTARADLDLHVALEGSELFQLPGDACWCNRAADWGVQGVRADDPRLDLDDRSGLGPENISIPSPAAGRYDVRVHYFDDHGDDLVTATVRIYLLGSPQPAFQASRNLRRNQVWDVARVNWPEATAGALSRDLYTTARRRCYTP